MSKEIRVTILMPVYNVEKYVKEAIESILNQTYKSFELLVLDDCSTDDTAQIVKSFTDERIRYIRHEKNLGLADNLNRGIELANTEYLARMDGDDISVSICLEKQINFLDSHPEIGVCGVGFQFFGTKSSTVFFPKNHNDIMCEQLFGNAVIQPMFRRSIFIDNNLRYKTSAFPAEDYRMWAECLRITKIHNIRKVLFHYRMHSEQISTEKKQAQIDKSNEVRLYMLEWLNPYFSEEEKHYFINTFVPGKINNKRDFIELQNFAVMLERRNKNIGHFDAVSLHRRLKKHLELSVYYVILELYFINSFSIKNFKGYAQSGLILRVPFKLNMKILIKSLLRK